MAEDKGRLYLGYLLSSHFVIHVFTFLLPVLLLPFQEELGISLVQVSLLSSIPKLLNVLIYIPTGVLSDRYPSQILTASFAITIIASILIPTATTFPLLLVGFILLSVGSTLYHPPSLKMASEYSTTKITQAMGIHNIGSSLGFAAGPFTPRILYGDKHLETHVLCLGSLDRANDLDHLHIYPQEPSCR